MEKKLYFYSFSQNQKSNRSVIRGKKISLFFLTEPQKLKSFTWKKPNFCFFFSQNNK